jgi:hypothetical protein
MPPEVVSVILSFVDVQDRLRSLRLVSLHFRTCSDESANLSWPPVMVWDCAKYLPTNQLSPGQAVTNQGNFAAMISPIVSNNLLRRVVLTEVYYPTLQHFSFSESLKELTIELAWTPENSGYDIPLHTSFRGSFEACLPSLPWGAAARGLTSLSVYKGGGLPGWAWTSMLTRCPLSTLTSLTKLVLTIIPVGDEPVRYLRNLPLESLDLSLTSVTDEAMSTAGAIRSLHTLRLRMLPQVTDAGLQHLVGLTCLRSLDLSHTSVTDAGMPSLASLTSLTALALVGNNRISDVGLQSLAELPLNVVDLARTSVSTTGVLRLLRHSLPLNLIGMTTFRGDRTQMEDYLKGVVDLTEDSDILSIV